MSTAVIIPGGTFAEDTHTYLDNRGGKVVSVTQAIAMCGLVDYRFVKQEVLEWKSSLGMAVHRGIELMVQNDIDWDTIADAAMGFMIGADTWFREMNFVSEEQEQQGIHSLYGMQYGYRFDHRGELTYRGRRRKAIVDIKCTSNASPAWALQLAGYEMPSPKLPNGERYLRVALKLSADGKCKPYFFEDPSDERVFTSLLPVAIWKTNHSYQNYEYDKALLELADAGDLILGG
jgi:hypothetical protein